MKNPILNTVFGLLVFMALTLANEALATKENNLLVKLQKHHNAQEYSLVYNEIDRYFSQKDTSLIDKDTVTSVTKWLKDRFIQDEQINPLYGHILSQMLAALYEGNNKEDPKFQGVLMSAISQFYVSAIVNESDIRRCADKTSGQNYLLLFNMKARQYKEYYRALPKELQTLVLRSIESSRQYEEKRKKNVDICKTGIKYMNKVLSSGNYKSTEKESPEHLGGKVQIISSELEPEFVSDDKWREGLDVSYKKWIKHLKEADNAEYTSQPARTLPTDGGDIQIPDPPGFMEVSKHFPNLREFQGLSTTGEDERFFIYIPLDTVAHYILSRSMNIFNDVKIIAASATVHENRNVTDYKFKKLKERTKEKFSAMLDKSYKKSGEQFEKQKDSLKETSQIQTSRSISQVTQLSGIIEDNYYLQMTGLTGVTTNASKQEENVSIQANMITETAMFPVNGHLVNMFIVGQNLTSEEIKAIREDLKKWSNDMILSNAQYPKTKETSRTSALVFFLVILSLAFFLGRKSKKVLPHKTIDETISNPISAKDAIQQDQAGKTIASASYIDLVETKENKEDFLAQFFGYQNNSLKTLLKIILFMQCTAYWAMIGFLYNGLERVNYMMIFLFFASCLNILAVVRKDKIAQAWVPYLNGFGVLANLICFIYFYIMTAASFNITQGDAALIWIALGSLFVYVMPYSVPRERVSFFVNILKHNLEGSPDKWLDIKNELRSKKEFKSLRTKLFNYKIEEPDKLKEYTEQIERSFRNNHGKPKQWVLEYLPRNSDTIALFSICNLSPTKATSLILADLENRHKNL